MPKKRDQGIRRRKQREFKPGIFGGLVIVVVFYLAANWMPHFDYPYFYLSSFLLALYMLILSAAFFLRLEKWYPYCLYGMLILPAAFSLFSGLKSVNSYPFLKFLIIAITVACFFFGFWAENLFPRLKGKDWFLIYFFAVLALTMPPLFIMEATMGDWRVPGIMRVIFGEEKGTQILTYLLGFAMPPFMILLAQTLYWKIAPRPEEIDLQKNKKRAK